VSGSNGSSGVGSTRPAPVRGMSPGARRGSLAADPPPRRSQSCWQGPLRSATPSGSRSRRSCRRRNRHVAVLLWRTGACSRAYSGSCIEASRGAKCRQPTAPGIPPTAGISAGVRTDSGTASAPSCTPRPHSSVPGKPVTVTVVLEFQAESGVGEKILEEYGAYIDLADSLTK